MKDPVKVKVKNLSESGPVLVFLKSKSDLKGALKKIKVNLFDWQMEKVPDSGLVFFETKKGILGVLISRAKTAKQMPGEFIPEDYAFFRDKALGWLKKINFKDFNLVHKGAFSSESIEGLAAGITIASYRYQVDSKVSVGMDKELFKSFKNGVVRGESVNSARKLVDFPANILNPKSFKDLICEEFSKASNFKVKTLDRKALIKQNFSMISAVGQGAEEGPFLVHVSYSAKGAKKRIGCVGKGITFDTGGLDIKPSAGMRLMKKDMGGAGSLFGFAKWVKAVKPKVSIDFVFAIAENVVSGDAFRPGDILKAQNGLTVEIDNTDAEGRLALGSGLNYLSTLKKNFDVCFDIATLTGAIKYGLDDRVGGLFSNNKDLGSAVQKSSEKIGDPVWLMPLPYWTRPHLNSPIADLVNSKRGGFGGAISAAEFLRCFVPKDTPWFHLDLYCWTTSSRDTYASEGGTGQGVQLLQQWLEDFS